MAGIIDSAKGVPTQWGGLSPHLVAKIFPCDHKGMPVSSTDVVMGPVTDANFEATFNWQNPFENTGPESKIPTLMAMAQTGQLGVVANALQASGVGNQDGTLAKGLAEAAKTASKDLLGRTGITKLNSTQCFTGMPPMKVNFTLHFRAMADPSEEVVAPYQQLLEWAVPQELAEDGFLANAIKNSPSDAQGLLKALFPSKAPQLIGFYLANERYSPMVIESISNPIDGPRDRLGRPLSRAVQVSISTLTALAKSDVSSIIVR